MASAAGSFFERGVASLPGPGVKSLARLPDFGGLFAGEAAMSLGLLTLVLVPVITVILDSD